MGDLHLAAGCFLQARDDYETELEVHRRRIVESSCLRHCYRQNPCHRASEMGGDDIVMAERRLRVLSNSRSFLLMSVSNPNRYHSLLILSHSAVAAMLEVLV